MNKKNCGRCNVRKHIEIKNSDKYFTSYTLLKFGSMDKTRITSLETKEYFVKISKGVDYLSGYQGQSKVKDVLKGRGFHWK